MRQSGVTDRALLQAFETIARERFAPAVFSELARVGAMVPLAHGQTMTRAETVAMCISALGLREGHRVLEIGTGSGWQTALLAAVAREVISLERYQPLAAHARRTLLSGGHDKAQILWADGLDPSVTEGVFDRIIVNAGLEQLPDVLWSKLAPDGVLVAPFGPIGSQTISRVTALRNGPVYQPVGRARFALLSEGTAEFTEN